MEGQSDREQRMKRATPHLAVAPNRSGCAGEGGEVEAVIKLNDVGSVRVLDDVQWRLDTLLETGARTVVVDMSEVGHLSSRTIAALLWVQRCCAARGVDMMLRQPSRRSVDTLERSGILMRPYTPETVSTAPGPRPGVVPPLRRW